MSFATLKSKTEQLIELARSAGEVSDTKLQKAIGYVQLKDLNEFEQSNVTLNLPNVTSLEKFYYNIPTANNNVTVKHLTITKQGFITNVNDAFNPRNSEIVENTLEHLTLNFGTEMLTDINNFICGMTALKIIDGWDLDFSSVVQAPVYFLHNCIALEEIRFAPGSIKCALEFDCMNLSDESIASIIAGLADLNGEIGQTVIFHHDLGPRISDTQRSSILSKNWSLYIPGEN